MTGAGRGIGRATAEAFAAEGYTVMVAELRPELGRRTERALVKSGGPRPAVHVPPRPGPGHHRMG
ncbi:MAG: SDR family oxidoreductase [Candidatus Rokubacteria bacterium]|nr:SDR family oxidoreductase [Candidatus Rokubacteria bacterium]